MEQAIQVSPIEESEMQKVRDFFERLANNALAATSLSAQVQAMQRDMESLSGSVDRLKNEVTYYMDQATAFRRKSEELQQQIVAVTYDRDETQKNLVMAQHSIQTLTAEATHSYEHISAITQDRDTAQLRVMELEDANKSLTEKLEGIHKLLAPELPASVLPNPIPAREVAEPRPLQTEKPTTDPQEPKRVVTSKDDHFDWTRSHHWDAEYQAYVYDF